MKSRREYYGGRIPLARHALRVVLNRCWSFILRGGLGKVGSSFNVDFTSRILGGKRVAIGSHFYATRGLKIIVNDLSAGSPLVQIGNHVALNEFVTIAAYDPIHIGDHVLVGSRVYIGNVNHGHYGLSSPSLPTVPPNDRPLIGSGGLDIASNVWIGEGAIIPGGIVIGEGSIIAAGSIVTKDVPRHVIVAGNPARVVKRFDPEQLAWTKPQYASSERLS